MTMPKTPLGRESCFATNRGAMVGSIALALILFDGGLRTRFATFRNVLAPAVTLATVGVLITAILTAPVAKLILGLNWIEALLIGAVIASTDAAAVFFLINARGLRLRPRVRAVLEVESGTNDPFAIFLALLLVEILLVGNQSWSHALITFLRDAILGCVMGFLGGRIIAFVLNRLSLAQGLHAPFVAVSALVTFALANILHSSGFLAVYLAGLVVGNMPARTTRKLTKAKNLTNIAVLHRRKMRRHGLMGQMNSEPPFRA